MRYAGIDIGGTKCAVTLGEANGESVRFLSKERFETDVSEPPENVIERFCAILDGLGAFEGIGISCGGPLSSKTGRILAPPNLPLWTDVPIVEMLQKRYGVPARLQNDANACALAEWRYGAGRGCENMIFLTCGTGFGAGLILDGRLYSGTNDMAGEIGHVRLEHEGPVGFGKSGSCEGFCSGGGIKRLAESLAEKAAVKPAWYPDSCDAKSLAEAARAGDEAALEVWRVSGEKLGAALAMLVDLFNPERVVIGSIFARSGDLLRPHMERVLRREAIPRSLEVVEILPAALGEELGNYAAICAAMGDAR